MLAAHMTRRFDFLAESLAGAVQPDVQVVQCKAERRRCVLRGCAVEIHALEQVAILFRQAGQKALETLAQDPFGGGIGLFGKLGLQAFERAVADIAPPIQVNDRVAQNAIEPRHRAFAITRLVGGLECLEQAVLHEVGGQMRVAYALPRERHEGVQILDQGVFDFDHERRVAVSQQPGNRRRRAAKARGVENQCNRIAGSALAGVKEAKDRFDSEQRTSL